MAPESGRGLHDLRRRYFASHDAAHRFNVSFDDVRCHLQGARRYRPRLRMGAVVFMDDLLHGVALGRAQARAWDLIDSRYVMPLIQRCVPLLDDVAASLHVRRVLHRLRFPAAHEAPFLQFAGTQPLGLWLTERVVGAMPSASGWRFGPLHEMEPSDQPDLRLVAVEETPTGTATCAPPPAGAAPDRTSRIPRP